ncbi:hypothetical protein D0T56_01790 [Dysgonomonas sp. 520]|nr:hypothetical protein [Dysgonomonas sp. 520]
MMVCMPLLFTNCASMFTKSTYPVAINSTPADANLVITDKKGNEVFVGKTPSIVKLKSSSGFFSKAEYQVKISMDGYADRLITINSSIEGWYFANILFGGLIGMLIVDPATGAMWTLDTETINATLNPENGSDVSLIIKDINEIPQNERGNLVRLN